jgi:hypothetical protein
MIGGRSALLAASSGSAGGNALAPAGDTVTNISVNGVTYRVHSFTSVGTSSLTIVRGGSFEYLVIAGGGAGGPTIGGGGGAGGYRVSVPGETSGGGASAESPLSLTTGSVVTVVVGAGGVNSNGGNSQFGTIVSIGGGSEYGSISGGSGGGRGYCWRKPACGQRY